MTGKKKYCAAALLTMLMGLGTAPAASFALDSDGVAEPDLDAEVSTFATPAQAQHAANLAEQVASTDESVQEALQDVQDAQSALDDALQSDDPAAVSAAPEALAVAEAAYIDALAGATGVIGSDIAAMRASGMGWGMIAHELGVQPALLGLGHTRGKQEHYAGMGALDPQELAEATARTMESGWSLGHGVGVLSGVHDPGIGLFTGQAMLSSGMGDDTDHQGHGGVSGAGGLGSGGNPGDGMGGGDAASGDHGASSGQGGAAGNSGGPGNAGGAGAAGTDGSPGNSGSSGGHDGASGSSSSGGPGASGGHGDSAGSGW